MKMATTGDVLRQNILEVIEKRKAVVLERRSSKTATENIESDDEPEGNQNIDRENEQ